MKRLKYISLTLISAILISIIFSSCFADITEVLDKYSEVQETTQEATKPKPLEPSDTGYSYELLEDPVLKELYALIHKNSQNKVSSTDLEVAQTLSEHQIRWVMDAYMYDHPEVFWIDSMFTYGTDGEGVTTITIYYTMKRTDLEKAKEKFDLELEKAVSQAPQNATSYELEMYAHDYIVDNCEYDYEAAEAEKTIDNENNAYGVLVDKKAVCSGYSMAFQLLCNKLGIECINVVGDSEGESHQWNCVKLDDAWYQVDVTWDDSENGELCQYDYFNLTDEKMYKDHTPLKLYSEVEQTYESGEAYNMFVPECINDKYSYYNYSCATITDIYNSDEIVEYIAKSAKDGKKYAEFLIDESLDYTYTVDSLLYDGYMYDWIEKANDKNGYFPELDPQCSVYKKEDINVITVELIYL